MTSNQRCPTSISPFEPRPQALRRFTGELDGHLQESYREVSVDLCGHPETEVSVYELRLCHGVHQLIHKVQTQMAVLQ